ncbi:MAG: acyl-ACP--UDP-N-acetylglucosamine O-acyltransferase [Polyangiaceae bacterium]|nr:acyl-ACP--UDP-N-acetylglucosamine O-acyltransferase [Polyangiaceae bacterium]
MAPSATLDDGVEVGPYAVVGDGVHLGAGTRLMPHAVVLGPTTLGARNVVHPFAALGGEPQDRSYRGEPTRLVVGDENVFREHVTVNRGTAKDRGETRIGAGNLLLAGAHVGHDCAIGDGVLVTNAALLGGHVVVGDHAVLGGGAAIAPFRRIGRIAFVAGGACVERDVPPFVIAAGDRARVRALNVVGLERRGVPGESLARLRRVFRRVFAGAAPRRDALDALSREADDDPWVRELVQALTEASA